MKEKQGTKNSPYISNIVKFMINTGNSTAFLLLMATLLVTSEMFK